jgi:hypothetical protein
MSVINLAGLSFHMKYILMALHSFQQFPIL